MLSQDIIDSVDIKKNVFFLFEKPFNYLNTFFVCS